MGEGDKKGCDGQKPNPLSPDNFWGGSGVPKFNPGESPSRGEKEEEGKIFVLPNQGKGMEPTLITPDNF